MLSSYYRFGCSALHRQTLVWLVALCSAAGCAGVPPSAPVDEQVLPQRVDINWSEVSEDARALSTHLADVGTDKLGYPQINALAIRRLESFSERKGMLPLAGLGELADKLYPGVALTPVPVLAPIDTGRLVSEQINAWPKLPNANERFYSRSIDRLQLVPKPTGYDLIATVSSSLLKDLGITTSDPPQLHIAGSAITYSDEDLDPGKLTIELQDVYPGIHELQGHDEITYSFRKYGVPYFVNVACRQGPFHAPGLSCEQAKKIARGVLRDLRLIGGAPLATKLRTIFHTHNPTKVSNTFRYHPPGVLLSGTSATGSGGSTSRKVYGFNLRFPIKDAPVFANTQTFLHWGDCLRQQVNLPRQPGDEFDRYKCRQNPSKELLKHEGHAENYAYPWFDNYCEDRAWTGALGCPGRRGRGHQGQDLRPAACVPTNARSRCEIDIFDVVAVTDGCAWWKTGDHENHLRLNTADLSGLYFMYLHMSPKALGDAGMVRGDCVPVRKGQKVGKIGNYLRDRPGLTTAHLHFEIRIGTDIGTPQPSYMTLVRAYERLIGAKGVEIPEHHRVTQ